MKKSEVKFDATAGSLESTYNAQDKSFTVKQDIEPVLKSIDEERKTQVKSSNTQDHIRKFATIPAVVVHDIEIKHGISLYDPDIFHDDEKKAKLMLIIRRDYPHLVVNS